LFKSHKREPGSPAGAQAPPMVLNFMYDETREGYHNH
jgi:hypothetical protein